MPSKSVQYLTLDEVLEMHQVLIDRFAGTIGIRDTGLLESALFRPSTGYYSDLIQMAAAMFESLINNHPFVDGNKRVAFFATDVFLRLNGFRIDVDGKTAYKFLINLFNTHTCDLEHLEPWLRSVVRQP